MIKKYHLRQSIPLLVAVTCIAALSGCAMPDARPITASPKALSLSLPVTDQGSLSSDSISKINTMLQAQGRLENQVITLMPLDHQGGVLANKLRQTLTKAGAKSVSVRSLPAIDAQSDQQKNDWDIEIRSEAITVNSTECGPLHPDLDKYPFTNHPYYAMGPLGCVTRHNLAKMVSNPKDIIQPQLLDDADGTTAVGAIERFQNDNVKKLPDINFDDKK